MTTMREALEACVVTLLDAAAYIEKNAFASKGAAEVYRSRALKYRVTLTEPDEEPAPEMIEAGAQVLIKSGVFPVYKNLARAVWLAMEGKR